MANIGRIFQTKFVKDDDNFKEQKKTKICNGIFCDVCHQNPVKHRWTCGNCGNFDLCFECHKISLNEADSKYNYTWDLMEKVGHRKAHVLYRTNYMMKIKEQAMNEIQF